MDIDANDFVEGSLTKFAGFRGAIVFFSLPQSKSRRVKKIVVAKFDDLLESGDVTVFEFSNWRAVETSISPQNSVQVNSDPLALPTDTPYKTVPIPGGFSIDDRYIARAMSAWAQGHFVNGAGPSFDIRIAATYAPSLMVNMVTAKVGQISKAFDRSKYLMADKVLTTASPSVSSSEYPIPVSSAVALVALGGRLASTDLPHSQILSVLNINSDGYLVELPALTPQPVTFTGGEVTKAIFRAVESHAHKAPTVMQCLSYIKAHLNRTITREQLVFLVSELQGLRISGDRVEYYVYK